VSGLDDLWFHGARWIHIAAGAFAALVLFPLQFLAAPGGPRHRARRRIVTVTVWVIAIAGAAMLVNPEFSGFWATESTDLGYATFFSTQVYEPLFFVYLDVILLYLVLTGMHVWRRDRGPDASPALPRPLDVTLALGLLGCSVGAIALGVVDWDTGFTWTRPFVGVGVFLSAIVVWDIASWRGGFRPRPHTWQHHHTTRLVVAWAGLFYAVELRARIRFDAMAPWSHRIDLAWLLLVAAALVAANARFRRDARHVARRAQSTSPAADQ
jgi:hypothetical protein